MPQRNKTLWPHPAWEAIDHFIRFGRLSEEDLKFEDELKGELPKKPEGLRTFSEIERANGLDEAINVYVDQVGTIPFKGFTDGTYAAMLKRPNRLDDHAVLYIENGLAKLKKAA